MKKKIISLKWKIARYLFVFALLIVAVIFIFQIVLLEPMYQKYKIETVKSVSDTIVEELDSTDLMDIIYASQDASDTCVRVQMLTNNSYSDVTSPNMGCQLYRLSDYTVNQLVAEAAASEDKTSLATGTWIGLGGAESQEMQNIIYTRIVSKAASVAVVMVYAGITPVNATTQTLTTSLYYIGAFLLAGIAVITFLMNRNIAKPLVEINEAAKQLPSGKFVTGQGKDPFREISELNGTLTEAAMDIRKADKAKRDLIANVSHDLRTPLTMITGYGEMMRDLPEEKTDANLQVIIDEAQRLNVLVNDLLDLSRLQDNRMTLDKEDFDLSVLISNQLRKYEVYVYRDGYVIERFLTGPAYINADVTRIGQVFNNFMINAINYSGNRKHIIVREILNDDSVQIQVRDFGEGIDEEALGDIWDRYYKIDKTHVRFTNGSGIGLAIVREILEMHNAKYGVVSKKGEGSTFWFTFPLSKRPYAVNNENEKKA